MGPNWVKVGRIYDVRGQKGTKWSRFCSNGTKWAKIGQNGLKWAQMTNVGQLGFHVKYE